MDGRIREEAAPLAGWDSPLVRACAEGLMGGVWPGGGEPPAAAAAVIGDFIFLAGRPDAALLARACAHAAQRERLLVPREAAWQGEILRRCGGRAAPITRYATRRDPRAFDPARLARFAAALPDGFRLSPIDDALYRLCRSEQWSADLVGQFPDAARYRAQGLGVAVLHGGRIVSGASSYARIPGGIEVQVDTRAQFRRQGLASACAAALILACLRRGLYPNWDAHNAASLALAEKLGYHLERAYPAFTLRPAQPRSA